MITIVGIADTHMSHEDVKVPPGDILVVAGDFSGHGTLQDIAVFNTWLGTLPHEHKLVVAGNHDLAAEHNCLAVRSIFTNATYLDEESATVRGIKFYGCPWTPEFFDWAFMYPRDGRMGQRIWQRVPEDTNVLITHGPPTGASISRVKDSYSRPGRECGCGLLRVRILELPNLKASFHGHIHSGHGKELVGKTTCMNVSVMDERYEVVNPGTSFSYEE